jgi:WNK lysine deficient protein kinase
LSQLLLASFLLTQNKEELGRGACKRVFKAFDTREGREVAWNKVELTADLGMEARQLLLDEIRVLRSLSHKNVMGFHDFWVDSLSQTLNFITELFVSGTLRQYRRRQGSKRPISLSIIIRWAYQILEGLIYLHAHVPPIIHRDLKCDNIFVNSNDGVIKIGDLGLATAQHGMSVVGTPGQSIPLPFNPDFPPSCHLSLIFSSLSTLIS